MIDHNLASCLVTKYAILTVGLINFASKTNLLFYIILSLQASGCFWNSADTNWNRQAVDMRHAYTAEHIHE